MPYAYVQNNIALEVVESDPTTVFSPNYASLFIVVPEEVKAGWVRTGGVWAAPTTKTISTVMSLYAFRKRFTIAEKIAIKSLGVTDPILVVLEEDTNTVAKLDMTHPDVAAVLSILVAKGILTAERRTEILTKPVQFSERP